jgi:transcriptional regulator with XRE-family HTH domain
MCLKLEDELACGYAEPQMATFGSNVRRLMRDRGIEPEELRIALGVKQGTLSDWMRDRRGLPEGPTLLKFAKALRASVEELIDGVDPDYAEMLKAESVIEGLALANDVDAERVDVSGFVINDLPVVAEGEASPQGNLFWDDEGKLQSEVEDRITRPHEVKDPPLLQILRDAWRRHPSEDLVVVYRTGQQLHDITGGVKAAAKAAKIPYGRGREDGATFHTLRHIAATLMSEDEADPLKLKDAMGHGDIRTTLKYRHRKPAKQRPTFERLAGRLKLVSAVTKGATRARRK